CRVKPGNDEFMASNNGLKNITGTIALAGAGKMGGAMLTGWLAGGLEPARAVVIEPAPSPDITGLASKGVRVNPKEVGGGAVVRAMPNTPAAIGRGITVAVPAKNVSREQRATADALLRATGAVEWVDDEALMDAVTAVSGSGPAYIFLLAEELARAGVAAGLPEALATRLARETVAGSGELLHRSDVP